ncbi:outer membrane beta-barrel protein [Calidifontimicrobium sp. SYSU G02091]|uniref:OmpW/AlkL family protein n=1 Tax=Calidifontimicrobium sp. SYSU G02091 TaxID=2926421 RepID=UPI001F533F2F|nr:OmpW family outer membrane protein [Calidifontimicrobium sp. SYSU G02091]MCI1190638.1 outer membrane beta-barrel protein [Calidifontimicrobium sp. SYSU G02091]
MKRATARAVALAAAAIAAATAVAPVQAQDSGNWIVRARALYLDPANKDNTGLDLSVNDKTFPEIDITYFFTPNLAAELILTYPQSHNVRSGDTKIGSIKHLPPTLSLQYHFTGMGWRPYVGLGINYTNLTSVKFDPAVEAALDPSLKRDSFGLAIGAGVDVPLGGGWLFNVDVKKVQIKTDVSSFGTKVGTFKIDPLLVGIGIGNRF